MENKKIRLNANPVVAYLQKPAAEFTRADGLANGLRKLVAEGFVEWDRVFMRASTEPTGAIAFLVAGVERELAHDEGFASDIEY